MSWMAGLTQVLCKVSKKVIQNEQRIKKRWKIWNKYQTIIEVRLRRSDI